jgi:hypothetical protein
MARFIGVVCVAVLVSGLGIERDPSDVTTLGNIRHGIYQTSLPTAGPQSISR